MSLEKFEIVIALLEEEDKDKKSRFFEKIFLLTNLNINIVLAMLLFNLNNIKINFLELKLFSRIYIII